MEKYDNYKDSGIEWIGEIPSHWKVKKIKRLSPVKRGASPRPIDDPKYFDENGDYAWVRIADVSASERYLENTTQTLSDLGASLSVKREPNDFFLSIAGTVGKPIITKIKCCIHDGFVYFPDLKINPEYLYYIFSTGLSYQGLGKWGTQLNLNTDTVGEIFIPIPKEIDNIIDYLDRKTTEIDELIADKKRLLELYEEEKTAIINQAVTKGINPDVTMKESGIEWLGEIPEHWEVKNLRYLCKITTGGKDTENREDDGEFPFFVRSQTVEKISTYSYDGEAILTAGDGVGVCKVWHHIIGKFDFHQRVYMMYDFVGISGSYLFHYMKENFIHDVLKKSAKSTVDSLRRPMFLEFAVAFPKSEDEQKEIVQYIENEIARIDSKSETTEKLIDLLTEYRTALISEVVTGKIKVTE